MWLCGALWLQPAKVPSAVKSLHTWQFLFFTIVPPPSPPPICVCCVFSGVVLTLAQKSFWMELKSVRFHVCLFQSNVIGLCASIHSNLVGHACPEIINYVKSVPLCKLYIVRYLGSWPRVLVILEKVSIIPVPQFSHEVNRSSDNVCLLRRCDAECTNADKMRG